MTEFACPTCNHPLADRELALLVLAEAGIVSVAGHIVHLPPREYALLECLAARPGHLVLHETVHDRVWGTHPPKNPRVLTLQLVRGIYGKLRGPDDLIVSVPGLVYRLQARAKDLRGRKIGIEVEP